MHEKQIEAMVAEAETTSEDGMTFYRCYLCRNVVSKWDIERFYACPKCGHTKVSPSNLTFKEKLIQIIKHPMVWRWNDAVSTDD